MTIRYILVFLIGWNVSFTKDLYPMISPQSLQTYFSNIHKINFDQLPSVDERPDYDKFFSYHDIRFNDFKKEKPNTQVSHTIDKKIDWLKKKFKISKFTSVKFIHQLTGTNQDIDLIANFCDSINCIFNYLNTKREHNFTWLDLFVLDSLYLSWQTNQIVIKDPSLKKAKEGVSNTRTILAYKKKKKNIYELLKSHLISSGTILDVIKKYPFIITQTTKDLLVSEITKDILSGHWQLALSNKPFYADGVLMMPSSANIHDQLHFLIVSHLLGVLWSAYKVKRDKPQNFEGFLRFSNKTLIDAVNLTGATNLDSKQIRDFYFLHENTMPLKRYLNFSLSVSSGLKNVTSIDVHKLLRELQDKKYLNDKSVLSKEETGEFSPAQLQIFYADIIRYEQMMDSECQKSLIYKN